MSPQRSTKPRTTSSSGPSPQRWTLTRADLDAMPDGLRRSLLRYLERNKTPAKTGATDNALRRKETAALLREVSFDRSGRSLRALLDCFALQEPPTRRQLAQALPRVERESLGRYLAKLNRITAKTTGAAGTRLWHFHRREGLYSVHPSVRKWLRQLLPGIEHAGEHEEPLWE